MAYYPAKSSAAKGISFPPLESWNPSTNVATIAAEANGERVLCRISMEVLKECFNASSDEPMQAVAENRDAIRAAAKALIEAGAFEKDSSILIRRENI